VEAVPRRDDHQSPLDWLSPILWPDGETTLTPCGRSRSGWLASPSASEPTILIPDDAPAAARRAVRRYHDGFDPVRRARSLAAEAAMTFPRLTRPLLRGARVAPIATPDADRGVIDWLGELLDVPDLLVAIGLSIPKSNRKPVLQLLDRHGRCLGWAKIGWNGWTDALVTNEARWLERPTSDPLVVPELLHEVELCGRKVVVTSSLAAPRLPRRRPDALPPPGVFQAVAHRGTRDVAPIVESPWWHSVEAVLPAATERERHLVERTIEGCRGLRFEIGAWHGDLTPWNLMTMGRRVQLIDWELAADGVPVGFDLLHFHTQVGAEMKGHHAAAAIDRSARLGPQGLAAIGVAARNRQAVWRLYLVELVRRMVALRADGFPSGRLTSGPAALDRLERMIGGPGPGRGARAELAGPQRRAER
jgi:hypothetical protein